MPQTKAEKPRAVLVGVQLPNVSDLEHAADLAELGRLVHTLGFEVVGTVSQKRAGLSSGAILGSGKLKELAQLTGGSGVIVSGAKARKSKARDKWEEAVVESDDEDSVAAPMDEHFVPATMVVVDHEISPRQAGSLQQVTGVEVIDRTGVIVDIFHRHARSREARMQVEIARLNYVAPRLREGTGSSERQQGSGAGESSLELDRRKIRDRIAELKQQLSAIHSDQSQRRQARKDSLRVALVGYTNAGKSSLMRALTGSEVLVADQLFATLDTTVRALQPETRPRVLISDTVGFIKKLPHDLVASFQSTLDEALEASLLLLVIDASDETFESHLKVTQDTLKEIGADAVPTRLLFNKCDRISETLRSELKEKYPNSLFISAHDARDVAGLRGQLIEHFEGAMQEITLVLPYNRQGLVAQVYETARVMKETFNEHGRILVLRGLPGALTKLKRLVSE
jgi:GTPase